MKCSELSKCSAVKQGPYGEGLSPTSQLSAEVRACWHDATNCALRISALRCLLAPAPRSLEEPGGRGPRGPRGTAPRGPVRRRREHTLHSLTCPLPAELNCRAPPAGRGPSRTARPRTVPARLSLSRRASLLRLAAYSARFPHSPSPRRLWPDGRRRCGRTAGPWRSPRCLTDSPPRAIGLPLSSKPHPP